MEADEKLFEIWSQFDFNIDPINAQKEKSKFFSNKDYSPQFTYNEEPILTQFKKDLQNIKADNSWIGKLINQRREIILKKIALLLNRKAENVTKNSIDIFGKPDKKLVALAYKELKLKDELEIKNLSDRDAAKIVRRALTENNLNWRVIIRQDMSAHAKVDAAEKIIYIKKAEKFSNHAVERLIIHEVLSHIFRMENSQRQKYKLFQVGFPNYLETEEGLAAYNEEQFEYLLQNRLRRLYAGRVIAVHLALEKSFPAVFAELSKYFHEQDAWTLTVRAKRGLHDTSKTGGFTKDYLYFSGKLKVKEYLKKNPKDGLSNLYKGRIGVKHIDAIKDNLKGEIKEPLYLPKHNSNNSSEKG